MIQHEMSHADATPEDLDLHAAKRVSVLVGGHAVPLLPGHPVMDSAHSPWAGLFLETHHLSAVVIPEHEHATFCLHLQTTG
jgi:AraC family transcriptional regulator